MHFISLPTVPQHPEACFTNPQPAPPSHLCSTYLPKSPSTPTQVSSQSARKHAPQLLCASFPTSPEPQPPPESLAPTNLWGGKGDTTSERASGQAAPTPCTVLPAWPGRGEM